MRRLLKAIAILIGGFVGLILLAVVAMHVSAGVRLGKTYELPSATIKVSSDPEAIERGRHLATIGRCRECHGYSLGGKASMDEPVLGRIFAPNLTSGRGGVGGAYSDADWERAIRHGIGRDGRSLLITPAQFYYYLSDDDLADLIAYVKNLKPINSGAWPEPNLGPLGRVFLWLLNPPDWLPAEKILHNDPRPPAPEPGATASYGEYLWQITTCQVCHEPARLATGLRESDWSRDDFMMALRTGRTPTGSFSNAIMPWQNTRDMSDDELGALWLHLRSIEQPNPGR